jgi:hypothetical protein
MVRILGAGGVVSTTAAGAVLGGGVNVDGSNDADADDELELVSNRADESVPNPKESVNTVSAGEDSGDEANAADAGWVGDRSGIGFEATVDGDEGPLTNAITRTQATATA